MYRSRLSCGLAALSVALAVGCAKERDPISRQQPNALEKKFFVGPDLQSSADDPEFFAQGTLIRVGYGAAQDGLFTSTYAQPVTRVKWVIQEDQLVGRLTYERIEGSDGQGAGPASKDGQVAYIYKIVSHFDVRRSYNPVTGEELNIIEENTTDRPWYEREYMRVDWSKNLNEDAYELDTLSQIGVFGGVKYQPISYYVNDPADPDAPHMAPEDGYFDITNKAFAAPEALDLSFLGLGGKLPLCFLPGEFPGGSQPFGNCNPVELTIRQSFRKVPDTDYEPEEWDGLKFQAYGAFTTERTGYARNFGMSDEKWRRFIARYNIWQQSHYYADPAARTGEVACFTPASTPLGGDPHRDEDGNGTEDECEVVGNGSRCDEFKQRCTLPFRQRQVRPIVWYYTESSHPDYFEATRLAAHEWDVAMRSAVMTARYAECMRVEKNQGACLATSPVYFGQQDRNDAAIALTREYQACKAGKAFNGQNCEQAVDEIAANRGYEAGVIALAKMDPMVVLCHSPVAADDPEVCGSRGLTVRQGDLRYHQVNVIPTPQTPSPWGIYTDAHDPLTGETIAASINVWSHVNDLWSQGLVDRLRYVGGELRTEDVTEGTNIKDWVAADRAASGSGMLPRMSKAEMTKRLASLAKTTPEAFEAARQSLVQNPQMVKQLSKTRAELAGVRADARAQGTTASIYDARRRRARGTELEAELNTKMMQHIAGVSGLPTNEDTLRFSSPLQGGNPSIWRELQLRREVAIAEKGSCIMHEAPSPTSLTGLGDLLQEKFGRFDASQDLATQNARAEQMRLYLARRAHTAVILHEMGHSIGLRHNFVSSSDAMNYRPQYWQLRTKNGAVVNECTDASRTGEECVGPRWFDPVTPEEKKNLIWMFMQSSVMDYAGEYTQDLVGLGPYDFAAARMFYGDAVSVHLDSKFDAGEPLGGAVLQKMDSFGGILGFSWSKDPRSQGQNDIHYSQLNRHFQLIQNCKSVDPFAFRPSDWDDATYGPWHPILDGLLVNVNGDWTRCEQQPVDYASWSTLRAPTASEVPWQPADRLPSSGPAIDAQGRTRVPYGFGTDRWADLGNLAVYRHDNGADAYELFDFFITEQEVNHIFDNYRRGRQTFTVRNSVYRSLGRYNEKMRDGAKGLGLIANIYRDVALGNGWDYGTLWPALVGFFPTNALASTLAFDHFTRMLARPESGEHYRVGDVLRSANDARGDAGETEVIVPNGATGYYDDVGIGGRLVENTLAQDKGEYNAEYTINAGSYYDKVFSAMLMTESVDNFISDSRGDFVDGRYRAISLADLYPDGYRRWLGNNLTNDDVIKGVWVKANGERPLVDGSMFPRSPLGWTSWWTSTPERCFPQSGAITCDPNPTSAALAIDPEVGWEQQKFLIAWTLAYLPENQQRWWLDNMDLWVIGEDTDPGFENRIEFHDPNGAIFVAKTFGRETVFGKSVEKGVAARMLQYANELLDKAYVTEAGPDLNNDNQPDWYRPRFANGKPIVKWDPTVAVINAQGGIDANGRPGCNARDNSLCECTANRACVELSRYVAVPRFMRQALRDFGLAEPSMRGIW